MLQIKTRRIKCLKVMEQALGRALEEAVRGGLMPPAPVEIAYVRNAGQRPHILRASRALRVSARNADRQ